LRNIGNGNNVGGGKSGGGLMLIFIGKFGKFDPLKLKLEDSTTPPESFVTILLFSGTFVVVKIIGKESVNGGNGVVGGGSFVVSSWGFWGVVSLLDGFSLGSEIS
jgi:hypothetical protein